MKDKHRGKPVERVTMDPETVRDLDNEARRLRKQTGENWSRAGVIRRAVDRYLAGPMAGEKGG